MSSFCFKLYERPTVEARKEIYILVEVNQAMTRTYLGTFIHLFAETVVFLMEKKPLVLK